MNWQEKIEAQKALTKKRDTNRSVHVSLSSRPELYRWLKEQCEINNLTLSSLCGMILEAAMEQSEKRQDPGGQT